jgi:phosphate starvation-inducible PhoH-like protein
MSRKHRDRRHKKTTHLTPDEIHAHDLISERFNPNKKRVLQPRGSAQRDYDRLLSDWSKSLVFAMGPAGTGKTLFAVHHAIQAFNAKEIKKIVITRPAVSVHEEHGFLPGGLVDKMMPWVRPIFDIMTEYWSPQHIKWLMESELIEIAPLAFMRGRTFKDSWIIADEMQNATVEQMKMMLTRIGEYSRMVITGDLAQHDRGYEDNGLQHIVRKLERRSSKNIATVFFGKQDVERHPVVTEVLDIYDDNTSDKKFTLIQ